MQRRNARRSGHLARLNFIDGWQVFGTIGLVVGALTFSIVIANGREVLPATGSAVQLVLQTLDSESSRLQPPVEPTVSPTPSATPSPAATAPSPAPSAPRVPVRVVPPRRSQPPAPTQSATPTPVPIPTPTPTDRPCLYALCPSPSPLP